MSGLTEALVAALQAAEKALNNIRCCCIHTTWDATGPAVMKAREALELARAYAAAEAV